MKTIQLLTLSLSLAFCSCASNKAEEPARPVEVPVPQIEELEGDRDVEQHLELLILETKRRLGRKHVELQVSNTSELELSLRYALEWKNKRGSIIGGYHHDWMPLTLAAYESKTLSIQGPSKAAETWRFHAESLDMNSEESTETPSN